MKESIRASLIALVFILIVLIVMPFIFSAVSYFAGQYKVWMDIVFHFTGQSHLLERGS